jgi:N-acetylneuraminic acid mutarotase
MMNSHARYFVLLMAGLTLASCSDDPTAPSTAPVAGEAPEQTADFAAAAANQWVTRADMPSTTRTDITSAMVPNSAGQSILYAIGGRTPTGGSLSRVQAYNVATNTWSWKTPMPVPLFASNGAGVIGGKIYISGGFTSPDALNFGFYMYNPATDRWTKKSDPPGTSYDGVTGVINNKLYVATQCEQEDCEPVSTAIGRFLYRYDPATDQWTTLAPPPRYEVGLQVGGTIGGKLYVTGGGNKVAVYDPATNQWTMKTTANQVEPVDAGATLGAKLYALGRSSDAVYVYDPTTNAWTKRAAPPHSFNDPSATRVVLNGRARIEVVGGPRPGNNLAYIP